MKCHFCGAEVKIGEKCEYCDSVAEPKYYGFTNEYRQTKKPAVNFITGKQVYIYTVQKGDTLWSISKFFYGSGSMYHKIAKANKKLIKDVNRIQVGWQLKIPY